MPSTGLPRWAATGGDQSSALFGPITWEMLGIVHILLLTAALAVAGWFALQRGRFSPVLLAGAYLAGIFTFAHNMHERYLIPAVLLTLWAAARWNDRRLLGAAAGMTLTGFVNLCAVYVQVGTDDEWLTSASSDIIVRLLGLAETAFCVLLFLTVYDIVAHGHTLPLARPANAGETTPGRRLRQGVAGPLRWHRRELLAMGALTLATAVVSFVYLGDMTAPQNPLDATTASQTVQITIDSDQEPATPLDLSRCQFRRDADPHRRGRHGGLPGPAGVGVLLAGGGAALLPGAGLDGHRRGRTGVRAVAAGRRRQSVAGDHHRRRPGPV